MPEFSASRVTAVLTGLGFGNETTGYCRPFSGVTWNPSIYNVENHLIYIYASDVPARAQGGDPNATIGSEPGSHYYVQGSLGGGATDEGGHMRGAPLAQR